MTVDENSTCLTYPPELCMLLPLHRLLLSLPTVDSSTSPKRRLADEFGARYVVPFASVNDDSHHSKATSDNVHRNSTNTYNTSNRTTQHNIIYAYAE